MSDPLVRATGCRPPAASWLIYEVDVEEEAMNRRWGILAALTAAIALTSMVGTYKVVADTPEYLYVEADENSPEVQQFLARNDVHYRRGYKGGFSAKVEGAAKRDVRRLGFNVSDIPVYYPNGLPSDPTPYGIEQIYSDSGITQTSGGNGITIGHLDTGIDTSHPDLARRVVGCKDATGILALGDRKNRSCLDLDGHGTHTAGSAVADGGRAGTGIWGVAPEADLYAIKVCSSVGCFADDIAAAIDYLGDNNLVDVITMSIGGPSSDSRVAAAIAEHKDSILFVASAGNIGPGTGSIEYPAWDPNVVAVAAIDNTETVTKFSSRGIDDGNDGIITIGEIELAAAGYKVESTYPTYFSDADGYAYFSGTSMAAPHVAGLAAKLWETDPNTTRMNLRASVTDITAGIRADAGYDVASGYGLPHMSTMSVPGKSHIGDIEGTAKLKRRDKWQAYVTVTVHDAGHGPVHRADVEATWTSSDGMDTVTCRTRADGTCKFRSPRFDSSVSDVTFGVTGISHQTLTYNAADNHETTLMISKP